MGVSGYALAFASLMLICGSRGDNFGRKRLMLIGVVIFCASSDFLCSRLMCPPWPRRLARVATP